MTKLYEKLYVKDSNGRIRYWQGEVKENRYRTHSGLLDGKTVVSSAWTECSGKNIGKSNATTDEEQAHSQMSSMYDRRRERGYAENIDAAQEERGVPFKPMLAKSSDDFEKIWKKKAKGHPEDEEFVFHIQPKLDGVRCIMTKDGVYSRSWKPLVMAVHIYAQLQEQGIWEKFPDLHLDGELYNHELHDDFDKIISLARKTKPVPEDYEEAAEKLHYYIYDFYHPEWEETYGARYEFLKGLGLKNPSSKEEGIYKGIYLVDDVEVVSSEMEEVMEEMADYLAEYRSQGYEGAMLRWDLPYENKRSENLIKIKQFQDEEFEIIEVLEGKGNWAGYAKHLLLKLPNGETFQSGIRGNQEYAKELLERKDEFVGKSATVVFHNYTPKGVPRFPVAKYLYDEERWL